MRADSRPANEDIRPVRGSYEAGVGRIAAGSMAVERWLQVG